jgi:hypothetical protein
MSNHTLLIGSPKLACFLLNANKKYNPLHAALMPAASALKPLMLRYEEKSSRGGNIMGRGWKGRRCCAETRVARRVGGRDDSVYIYLAGKYRPGKGRRMRTSPLSHVLHSGLLDLLCLFVCHCEYWQFEVANTEYNGLQASAKKCDLLHSSCQAITKF